MYRFIVIISLFLFIFETNLYANERIKFIDKITLTTQNGLKLPLKTAISLKKPLQSYRIDIAINHKILNNKAYYLKIFCDNNAISSISVEYKKTMNGILIPLKGIDVSLITIYFKFNISKTIDIKMLPISAFEYENIYQHTTVIKGISFGIIFCAFLYNFVIYLNTKYISFFYYSMMQFFLLLFLVIEHTISYKSDTSKLEYLSGDLLLNLIMIMTILFSKEILETKKLMPIFDSILKVLIWINLLDIFWILITFDNFLYDYIPVYSIVIILMLAGSFSYNQGNKTVIFYILGWAVILISILIVEFHLLPINGLIILNIGMPIESLILSLALGHKLKQSMKEKDKQEQLFIHQSKLASMGEMINNIAHQWRQPLNNLSFINMDLQLALAQNTLKNDYLQQSLVKTDQQLIFMSKTINSFHEFYRPQKKKESFLISQAVQLAIDIIKPSLESSNITLNLQNNYDTDIKSYKNEISQIVLNFLSNAADVLQDRDVKSAWIKVSIDKTNNSQSFISVEDNAGGIRAELLNKIFEAYFTTKEHKGNGIGLYMSKNIAQTRLNSRIKVSNTKNGACFKIIFNTY